MPLGRCGVKHEPGQTASAAAGGESPPFDFAAQYQSAYRLLWLIAAGILGNRAGADDVVQEAAVLALARIDQFTPGTNFVAWMAQTVRYVAYNHARKRNRSRTTSLDAADPDSPRLAYRPRADGGDLRLGERGQVPPDQRHFDDRLVQALGGVSEVARACLLLRTVEGLEYSEIARLFSIPEGTAMSHVHRARQYLRQRLSGGGAGVGAGHNGVAHAAGSNGRHGAGEGKRG